MIAYQHSTDPRLPVTPPTAVPILDVGRFDDDPGGLGLKHDRFGLLSMANSGPNTNTAHFSIVVAPAPHLDGSYTIFGELVSGADVAVAINNVSADKPNRTAGPEEKVLITESGQIR